MCALVVSTRADNPTFAFDGAIFTFCLCNIGTLNIFMKKFNSKRLIIEKWQLCELRQSPFRDFVF